MFAQVRKAFGVSKAIADAKLRGLGRHGEPLTYLDIGARGGLPARWQLVSRAGLIRPAFVEADPEEARRLAASHPHASVIPHAVGDVDDEARELKITREPGRSSLLEPDIDVLKPFGPEPWEVVRRMPITLRRLDRVWPYGLAPPTFVKIDVQGFELNVLNGFGSLLDSVACIELEAVLVPFYRGQPTLVKVIEYLRASGFGLVRLASMGFYGDREMLEFNAFCVRLDRLSGDDVHFWKSVNGVGSVRRAVTWGY